MIHHGDEQIEQHHDVDDGIGPKHQHTPEASEDLNSIQVETIQVDKAKDGPEQRLCCFEEAEEEGEVKEELEQKIEISTNHSKVIY